MRIHARGRFVAALAALLLVAAACVAEPGASGDPTASDGAPPPAASAAASAAPSASAAPDASATAAPADSAAPSVSAAPTASAVACPQPLPLDPATGAMVIGVKELVALGDAAAACYGDAKLQLTGYVPGMWMGGFLAEYDKTPAWLYGDDTAAFLSSSRGGVEQWLGIRVPPSLGLDTCTTDPAPDCVVGPYRYRWVTVIGHFNDPASETCRATPLPGVDPADAPPIPVADSVAYCRTQFAAESIVEAKATGEVPNVYPAMCPVEPITIEQMVAVGATVGPWYGLACLGSTEMTFTAYVVPGVGLLSGMEQDTFAPRWLADPFNTGVVFTETAADAADPANWFVARVPPDLLGDGGQHACDGSAVDPESCPFYDSAGTYVTITGHYDDYESMSCRTVDPAGTEPSMTPDQVILMCRENFVLDSFDVASGPQPEATPPTTSTR